MKRNPKILFALFLTLFLFSQALGQDKPEPKAADKPISAKKDAPAESTLSAETVKALEAKNQIVRLAQLELENLQLKMAQAQRDLKVLQEAAQKVSIEYQAALEEAAAKVGVPKDKLPEYEFIQNKDGSVTLKKRAPKQ